MKVDFDYQLKENESAYPFYNLQQIDIVLPEIIINDLKFIFGDKKHKLKTWGNSLGTFKPHYIAVQKQTPLHTDKGYNKYTHHLVLYCDNNFSLRGLNKEEIKVTKGSYFVLDGHSPHQLLANGKNEGFYLSASIDNKTILETDFVLEKLLDFIKNSTLTKNCHGKNL